MMKKLITAYLLVFLAGMSLAQGTVAPDISRISAGARTLGMGKTFAGEADDVFALFLNPSGLSEINRWQVSSMSGKIMDYNYMTFLGVYPTNAGNFGLGLSSATIGGAYFTKMVDGTELTSDPLYEYDYSKPPISYTNNVYVLSYGSKMERLLNLPLLNNFKDRLAGLKDVKVGANLKFFSSGLSNIANASGSGNEMDLGLLADVRPFLRCGLMVSNLLPASLGGKLTYHTNHYETYPVNLKLGTALKVLGKRDALREFGQELKLLLDFETYPTRQRFPLIAHLGAEWAPIPLLTLRAGIDQDATESIDGQIITISNLTAGVGLTYQQFRFDFAFHQFAGVTGQDNYFFSLTYGLPVAETKYDVLEVFTPRDKTITKESTVQVAGKITQPARFASINKMPVVVNKTGLFSEKLELAYAKNKINVAAQDISRKTLESEDLRLCRLRTFKDVPLDSWSAEPIGYIATLKIIEGYPDSTFRPLNNITRAEMTAVLIRAGKITPEAEITLFSDVPLTNWAAKYIMPAAKLGVVKGYPDGGFKPQANVSRAEGLAMIARFSKITEEAGTTPYSDVPANHWAAPVIKGSYRAGMLQYIGTKPFEPNKKLTREEAVEMLFRSPYVQSMIKEDLLNWETY